MINTKRSRPTESSAGEGTMAVSILRGAAGFSGVSVTAFAVWAFGAGQFRGLGGEAGMYVAIAVVFVALTGLWLHPLVLGKHRMRRFYGAFVPAFLAYASVWSGFWFWLKFGAGEWLGGFVGSLTFVALIAWRLGRAPGFVRASAVFFGLHTGGYWAGGYSMAWLVGLSRLHPTPFLTAPSLLILAKLSWGLFYGLGFGAGLGYVFATFQRVSIGSLPTHFGHPPGEPNSEPRRA